MWSVIEGFQDNMYNNGAMPIKEAHPRNCGQSSEGTRQHIYVAKQRFEIWHTINFSSTSILDKATQHMDHMTKVTIKIRLHPRNLNREGGFTSSQSW
jgi:hypothetical protein